MPKPNKDIIQNFFSLINTQQPEKAFELYVSENITHNFPHLKQGKQNLLSGFQAASKASPNKKITIKEMISDPNTVVTISQVKNIKRNDTEINLLVAHWFELNQGLITKIFSIKERS
ncbi:MAG: nuclear transport factor 2 family protein [Deltaproteobacteria bacterium]|nr:nuclear transport factor 2 family protein [Deltaproteobacteria bacterium]